MSGVAAQRGSRRIHTERLIICRSVSSIEYSAPLLARSCHKSYFLPPSAAQKIGIQISEQKWPRIITDLPISYSLG